MTRREALVTLNALAATLGRAAERLPANKNVKWGLGSNLWNSFKGSKFTDILDVMRDTGFIGLRLTQFPRSWRPIASPRNKWKRRSPSAASTW